MKKVLEIIKLLLYGWLLYIIFLIRLWILRCKETKGQTRQNRKPNCDCNSVNTPVYKRPDPYIYDQYYMMQQNITGITWDNPDMKIYPLGTVGQAYSPPLATPLSPDTLLPGTEYLVAARIWNSSTDSAALGVEVSLSYLSFGVGTVSHSIPDPPAVINIGVKTDSQFCPAYAYMKWTTPVIPGHYCLQVLLNCTDDTNPNNNLGQLNTNVVAAQSPAIFSFLLRNPDKNKHTYNFKVDSYTIPKKDPCKTNTKNNTYPVKRQDQIAYARSRNNASLFPVPAGWTVHIDPETNTLEGREEKIINVSVIPPDTFIGEQPINIHAFTEKEELTGGVTVYITKQ